MAFVIVENPDFLTRTALPRRSGRSRWTRRERVLTVLLIAYALWVSWVRGGYPVWSLNGQMVIAALLLLGLFVPLGRGRDDAPNATAGEGLRALLKAPVFWMGLLLVGYVVIQNLNPAHYYDGFRNFLQIRRMEHISWLPSGLQAPYDMMNGWRWLASVVPAWVALCVLVAGLRRRQAVHTVLVALAVSGILYGSIALLQKLTAAEKMLWLFDGPPMATVWGTMINENIASAFQNMSLALVFYLFLYHMVKGQQKGNRGGPYLMLLPLGLVLAASSVATYSRAGIVIACVLVLFALIMLIVTAWREHSKALRIGLAFLSVLFVSLGTVLAIQADWKRLDREFSRVWDETNTLDVEIRENLYDASWRLWMDRPVFGWGAGAYRYPFPRYQVQYKELLMKKKTGYTIITFAHNSLLHYGAELGWVGLGIVAALVLWMPATVLLQGGWRESALLFFFPAMAIAASHGLVDFVFEYPVNRGILLLIIGAVCRHYQLSQERFRRLSDKSPE